MVTDNLILWEVSSDWSSQPDCDSFLPWIVGAVQDRPANSWDSTWEGCDLFSSDLDLAWCPISCRGFDRIWWVGCGSRDHFEYFTSWPVRTKSNWWSIQDGGTFCLQWYSSPLIPARPTHARPSSLTKGCWWDENRHGSSSKVKCSNIAGFNAKVAEYNTQSEMKLKFSIDCGHCRRVGDLMMAARKEVKMDYSSWQKARAAGIHMILVTQRPSVDVISGLTGAKYLPVSLLRYHLGLTHGPSWWNGAEKLLGRGDTSLKPTMKIIRVAWLSDPFYPFQMTMSMDCNFVKEQAEVSAWCFDPGEVSRVGPWRRCGWLWRGWSTLEEAVTLWLKPEKASASMIQRRLPVGFNRAILASWKTWKRQVSSDQLEGNQAGELSLQTTNLSLNEAWMR